MGLDFFPRISLSMFCEVLYRERALAPARCSVVTECCVGAYSPSLRLGKESGTDMHPLLCSILYL